MGYNTEVITNIADTDLQIAHANGHYYIVRMYGDGYHEVLGDLDAGMMKQLAGFCYEQRAAAFEDFRMWQRRGAVIPPTPDDVEDL